MTPQIVQVLIGLVGALLGVAATWGANRKTIEQLTDAVKKLNDKVEMFAALERTDALHAQEAAHQREHLTRLEQRVSRLEEHALATPHHGTPAPRR